MNWKFTNYRDWQFLSERFQWIRDMENTSQHTVHHGEGNVAIHTQMVLNELIASPGFGMLTELEQEVLWTAALLHDVEKRSCSVDEGEGRISAYGHARKGEYTARTILYRDIPAPFALREQIASLVRFHGLPLWLMEKENPEKKVAEVSLRLDTCLLKLLALADIRGRICRDSEQLLETVELFELFCQEKNCWRQARAFATPNARYHYFNQADSYIDYVPHDGFDCEVTLLSGLPGMGKDYYIRTAGKDLPVVSLDAIRRKNKLSPTDKAANGWVVQTAKEEARCYLRKKQDFIWNATNITAMMRRQLVDLFTSYKAKVRIVYIEKPYMIWRKQNQDREYVLPEHVLDKMLQKLEIPQLTEAHEVVYLVED